MDGKGSGEEIEGAPSIELLEELAWFDEDEGEDEEEEEEEIEDEGAEADDERGIEGDGRSEGVEGE